MAFTFVSTMDEVLRLALLPEPERGLADQAPRGAEAVHDDIVVEEALPADSRR
jgi:hypothetical protein